MSSIVAFEFWSALPYWCARFFLSSADPEFRSPTSRRDARFLPQCISQNCAAEKLGSDFNQIAISLLNSDCLSVIRTGATRDDDTASFLVGNDGGLEPVAFAARVVSPSRLALAKLALTKLAFTKDVGLTRHRSRTASHTRRVSLSTRQR
jgi:hypothetical protein